MNIVTGAEVTGHDGDGVRTADGRLIPAATVLAAIGNDSDSGFATALREAAPELEVVTIGSAARNGRVFDALHGAFFEARRA